MKQRLYHIFWVCLAAVSFTACIMDNDLCPSDTEAYNGRITLDLTSASSPASRAQSVGAEGIVNHLDVLIFGTDGSKVKYERIDVSAGSSVVTLSAKRSDFEVGKDYTVYLIANSTVETGIFQAPGFDLSGLKRLMQEDPDIHMTGLPLQGVPQAFLMDGVARLKGSQDTGTTVVLNNGNPSDSTELSVVLRRAAAKIVVRINKGTDVKFVDNPTQYQAGYYLRNMPYSTSLVSGVNGESELTTPDINSSQYFDWSQDAVTVTAYTYAHNWVQGDILTKEVRLIVNIPLEYDADGPSGPGKPELKESNYYQIPVSNTKSLERNSYYEVVVTVNAPGGSKPSDPTELTGISYSVHDWEYVTVDVGGETERPAFLTLNEYEMEMHNMEDDNTTLEFASSSQVTATIDRVYYIDKFGQEKDLTRITSGSADEWGENTGSDYRPNWKNRCTIKITPDENITGKIHIHGDVPGNNAVRYIEFTVTNEDGISRKIKVAQYPLTYITNVEGYYSYRDDFVSSAPDGTSGLTTWLLLAGKNKNDIIGKEYDRNQRFSDWRTSCSWSNSRWDYGQGTNAFFVSKVAQNISASTGLCQIRYYSWKEQTDWRGRPPYSYNISTTNVQGLNNHRMYHVTITATSGEYTLGRPRITNGKTDPGEDNAVLVSPSFMLASQLGAVLAAGSVEQAASHCEQYVEVAQDGTVYDDWRLPTRAEVEIIYKYQDVSDVMDNVLSGDRYWSASGRVTKPWIIQTDDQAIRCIRDAYDKKTGK